MTPDDPQFFADRLSRFADGRALAMDNGATVSYRELTQRADDRARELGQNRALVLLEAAMSLETIVTYLAALRSRHAIILADPAHANRGGDLATLFRPDVLVSSEGSVQHVERGEGRVTLHPDLAVLLSTSGSTGSTKLVRLSYDNIQSNADSIRSYLGLVPYDAGALTLPLHYSYGLSVLNSHLAAGAGLCVWEGALTDPNFLGWLASVDCTNISGVPYSYDIFERTRLRTHVWDTLRFMTAAGGRLPPDIVRTYAQHFRSRGGRFFVMYGQTEATARIAYLPPDSAETAADCIGISIPGGELHLIDTEGRHVGATLTAGELVYTGPNIMMGYAAGATDLVKGRELTELRTGDLAERTEAGFFRIVGRKSRFSKIAGFRVSHDEIERRLAAEGIEAAVVGDDQRLVVAVTADADAEDVTRSIMSFSNVQASQVHVRPVDLLPRLSSGKIDYAAIGRLTVEEEPPRPASVMAAFSSAFWPEPVGPGDTFNDLGGDSLTFVQLASQLEGLLGRVPDGWERMAVTDIAGATRSAANWVAIDPNVYLRVAAILLVVGHHLFIGIQGGAFVLMTMVGYNMARFQSPSLFQGRVRGVLRQLLRNVLAYFAVLLPLMAFLGDFRWTDMLLLSNVIDEPGEPLLYNLFWFVEAYAWIVATVVAIFCIAPLRQAIRRRPLGAGLIALGISVLLVFAGRLTWDDAWSTCSQGTCLPTTEVAYWAAIGWCLYFARSWRQRIAMLALGTVTILALLYSVGNATVAVYLIPLPLLAWRVQWNAPLAVSRLLSYLAVNSYAIYLLHLIPLTVTQQYGVTLRRPGFIGQFLPITVAIGFSLIVAGLARWAYARAARMYSTTPSTG